MSGSQVLCSITLDPTTVRDMIRAGMQGALSVHKAQEIIYSLIKSVRLHLRVLATA